MPLYINSKDEIFANSVLANIMLKLVVFKVILSRTFAPANKARDEAYK